MKRRIQDAFPPVDQSFERSMDAAFVRIRKEGHRRYGALPRRAILVFAVLGILLLTTTVGFATGLIQSVFFRMQEDGFAGMHTTDYEALSSMNSVNSSRQTVDFSEELSAVFSLEQSYYNGEQLILGWSYAGPEDVEFYEKGDERFEEVERVDAGTDIESIFGKETVNAIYEKIVKDQWAGLFWYDVWMGDGVWLAGIQSQETGWDGSVTQHENTRLYPAAERIWYRLGEEGRYYECETPLPDAARNQQTLRILCKVYLQPRWVCFEGEVGNVAEYAGMGDVMAQEICFDIPLSGKYEEKIFECEAEFPGHTALVSVHTTPIYARLEVINYMPDEWKEAWEKHEGYYMPPMNLEEDCCFTYEVWVKKGEEMQLVCDQLDLIDSIERHDGQFVITDGTTEIVLRPVYANTGACADEDVVISIAE